MSIESLSQVDEETGGLVKDIRRLDKLGVHLLNSKDGKFIVQEVVKSSLCDVVKEKQALDPILLHIKDDVGKKSLWHLRLGEIVF